MFSSLRSRLFGAYALVIGLLVLIAMSVVGVYLVRNPAADRREIQRLRLISTLLLQRRVVFNLPRLDLTPSLMQEAVEKADQAMGVRVVVFDERGQVVADSRLNQSGALPDWSFFNQRTSVPLTTFTDNLDMQWLFVLTPMESGYSMLVASPRPKTPLLGILRDEFLIWFGRGVALAFLLSLLMAFWLSSWISRPLQRIVDATRSMSGGEFKKIPLEGPQEVQTLTKAFNEMGERVQASQRSQRDFIANVSHDLKTPLTSIQGFAQAIQDGTASAPEDVRHAAAVIHSEADRMYQMVMDLLELARWDARVVKFERLPVDLMALLKGIVEKFTPLAGQAQVTLELEQKESNAIIPPVIGDGEHLAQVFTNLLDNALKYTPPGGKVTLSLQRLDGWVEVRVADTGPGIPPSELGRIFERFYQTDKARSSGERRGIGLGLAIAREIVHAHGGTISAANRVAVDSQTISIPTAGEKTGAPITGSVFTVKLPLSR